MHVVKSVSTDSTSRPFLHRVLLQRWHNSLPVLRSHERRVSRSSYRARSRRCLGKKSWTACWGYWYLQNLFVCCSRSVSETRWGTRSGLRHPLGISTNGLGPIQDWPRSISLRVRIPVWSKRSWVHPWRTLVAWGRGEAWNGRCPSPPPKYHPSRRREIVRRCCKIQEESRTKVCTKLHPRNKYL